MSCSISKEATGWNGGDEPVCEIHQRHLTTTEPDLVRSRTQQSMVRLTPAWCVQKRRSQEHETQTSKNWRSSPHSNFDVRIFPRSPCTEVPVLRPWTHWLSGLQLEPRTQIFLEPCQFHIGSRHVEIVLVTLEDQRCSSSLEERRLLGTSLDHLLPPRQISLNFFAAFRLP